MFANASDGKRVWWELSGSGEHVVVCPMLHDPWGCLALATLLSVDHTVLRVDCCGFGESGRRDLARYTVDAFVGDVMCAVNAAGVDSFAVFGYAMPAWLAAVMSVREPRVTHSIGGGYSLLDMPHDRMPRSERSGEGYFGDGASIDKLAVTGLADASRAWEPGWFAGSAASRLVFYGELDDTWEIAERIRATRVELEGHGFRVQEVPGYEHNGLAREATVLAAVVRTFLRDGATAG